MRPICAAMKHPGSGRWSEDDIAAFLATGHAAGTAAFGSMKQVVENSGQYITPEDRLAIARYLKIAGSHAEQTKYDPAAAPETIRASRRRDLCAISAPVVTAQAAKENYPAYQSSPATPP